MSSTAIIESAAGKLEGASHATHQAFLGIPYATPPVGARRFCPPAPAQPWTSVRPAVAFAPDAPQPPGLFPGLEPGPQSEDCLFLNVYTPRADAGRRPVMVWIHGGAFVTGSGSQAIYAGGRLAARGDVVVVTINYRVGALGFLHLGVDGGRGEGLACNLGLLDQVMALRWVRENIAAFGGDPGNVTIFGESAGGMSVTSLLAMPGARGLFQRAIAQSGAAQATLDPEQAARVRAQVLAELGLAEHDVGRLREVPSDILLEAQLRATAHLQRDYFLVFSPVLDPATLPAHPIDAIRAGAAADVPLVLGTTRDEWRLFTFAVPAHRRLDESGLTKRIAHRVRKLGGDDAAAARIIETYRRELADSSRRRAQEAAGAGDPAVAPWQIFDAIESDRLFRIPAIRLAEAQREHQESTRLYLFGWPSPAGRSTLGACHALELPFVFGTLDVAGMARFAGSGPDAEALSERMMDSWLAFARDGDPSHRAIAPWPTYDRARRRTMVFDRDVRVVDDPMAVERAAWDGLL